MCICGGLCVFFISRHCHVNRTIPLPVVVADDSIESFAEDDDDDNEYRRS